MTNYRPVTVRVEPLWDRAVPHSQGIGPLHEPCVSVHLPDPRIATGCGIVICPGGGYRILASDFEGLQVAQALNEVGIAAFVLRYRVGPIYPSSVSLLDGQRAMRFVRFKSNEFGIDPCRVGLLGFSAGGHLTVNVGTAESSSPSDVSNSIDKYSAKPNFLVPVYAVTNGAVRGRKASEYTATNTKVNEHTPPTFLTHTHEDAIVSAEQSIIFYQALLKAGVQAELHIFGFGEHGIGLGTGDPDVSIWFSLLIKWIRRNGFLTSNSRVELTSRFDFGEEIPGVAWFTLVPSNTNYPPVRVKINRDQCGQLKVSPTHGPIPGSYTLQIRRISEKWPHDAIGDYSMDRETLEEYAVEIQPDGNMKIQ